MTGSPSAAHPWMANALPDIKQAMLDAIGAGSIAELFAQIPDRDRLQTRPRLPPALRSELALKRHLADTLAQNRDCERMLSFLGAGSWQHHVPAVVDEIVGRAEFLTPVWGSPQSDHGRNQAWFEYASLLGELLEMDVVQLPVYSWGCAAGHAIRMAARLTGRRQVLIPSLIDAERRSVIGNYCEPPGMAGAIEIVTVAAERDSGRLDLADLRAKLSSGTAAVYLESPGYLGVIEADGAAIAALARTAGAETIVGCDPLSLGVLAPPAAWGADIAVGPTQPLGVHMNCGGGVGGFIASRDEERYVRQYNGFLVSITETMQPGEHGFALSCAHQTSYGLREQGRDWTGNSVYLWAIANAVYMALLGPRGFEELGTLIVERAHYAADRLGRIPGLRIVFPGGFFKEFVVNFDGARRTVAAINADLLAEGIFGGKDVSGEFPELGQCALYCVTERHTQGDIDRLAAALARIVA